MEDGLLIQVNMESEKPLYPDCRTQKLRYRIIEREITRLQRERVSTRGLWEKHYRLLVLHQMAFDACQVLINYYIRHKERQFWIFAETDAQHHQQRIETLRDFFEKDEPLHSALKEFRDALEELPIH